MRTNDLRQRAAVCLRRAEQATQPADKELFLRMAQTWLDLAQNAEALRRAAIADGEGCTGQIRSIAS